MPGRPPVSERAAGNIYDLGYRRYDGARLGRAQAVFTLYVHSLRASFGFGRRTVSKIFPFAFAIIAFLPAAIFLGVNAIIPVEDSDGLWAPEEYYDLIEYILALFLATTAPELAGRDQRTRTLSLYFSRALSREDYAFAKLAAMTTALLVLTLGPQLLLFFGNGFVGDDVWGYFKATTDEFIPIVLSAFLISLIMSAIGLSIGAYVPRRSYATVAILAIFVIPLGVTGVLIGTADIEVGRWSMLLTPTFVFHGIAYWLFGTAEVDIFRDADFHGSVYLLAGIAWFAVGTGFMVRRFRQVAA
jgi:ABC-2 type transport system permease protein